MSGDLSSRVVASADSQHSRDLPSQNASSVWERIPRNRSEEFARQNEGHASERAGKPPSSWSPDEEPSDPVNLSSRKMPVKATVTAVSSRAVLECSTHLGTGRGRNRKQIAKKTNKCQEWVTDRSRQVYLLPTSVWKQAPAATKVTEPSQMAVFDVRISADP